MDLKQILIIGLFLTPVWMCKMHRCYEEHELDEAAERKLRSHYPQPVDPSPTAAPGSPASCPVELYQQQVHQELHGRSLSPWRYVLVTVEDHFPSSYAVAQCLCSGCIVMQGPSGQERAVESHDYNSVPIPQSRVFLKRERCSDGQKYRLRPVTLDVTVGCTCARVRTSS